MKICVDENIPNVTVQELRNLGHDVLDIRGTVDQGMDDDILWAKVQAEQRLLISTDKGFVWHRDESHWGILVVVCGNPMSRGYTSEYFRRCTAFQSRNGPGW